MKRPNIRTMNQRTLDIMRQKWCTPENFNTNYKIWADGHVEAGIARLNPDYDPLDPLSEYIIFNEDRLRDAASFDEMKAESDTGKDRRSKAERVVVVGEGDDGECIGEPHTAPHRSIMSEQQNEFARRRAAPHQAAC